MKCLLSPRNYDISQQNDSLFRIPGHLIKTPPCYSPSKDKTWLQQNCSVFYRQRLKTHISTCCSSRCASSPSGTRLIFTDQVYVAKLLLKGGSSLTIQLSFFFQVLFLWNCYKSCGSHHDDLHTSITSALRIYLSQRNNKIFSKT